MDISLINSEIVDLLSRITGQKLRQQDLDPVVLFMVALAAVLMGVIFVDKTVAAQEEQRLYQTLNSFIPSEGDLRQLTPQILQGVEQQQVYLKAQELLLLMSPFSVSEKLLLMAFGYQMSAADGDVDFREKMYLQSIANRIGIKSEHLDILEAGFSDREIADPKALDEVRTLLDPMQFEALDDVFVQAAWEIRSTLPTG